MSDLQSIATASCNISLVLAKSHSDVSSRLITKYKYKDFKKLQRIFFCGFKFCGGVYHSSDGRIPVINSSWPEAKFTGVTRSLEQSQGIASCAKYSFHCKQPSNIILNTILYSSNACIPRWKQTSSDSSE